MGHYRKIETKIWHDERFCALSDRGQLTFLFLLTHPHLTALGAMRATIVGLAAEKRWSEKDFRKALKEVVDKGLVKVDERSCFVWMPKFLRHNAPESPNVVKSWVKALDLIPECPLKAELIDSMFKASESLSEGFRKAFESAFSGGRSAFLNQEQEQEPEQEHAHEPEPEQEPKQGAGAAAVVADAFERFWKVYPAYRKTAKGKAREAFLLKAKSTDPEFIVSKATEYAESPLGKSKYAQGPTPWLNAERWNDDPKAWQRGDDDDRTGAKPAAGYSISRVPPPADAKPIKSIRISNDPNDQGAPPPPSGNQQAAG